MIGDQMTQRRSVATFLMSVFMMIVPLHAEEAIQLNMVLNQKKVEMGKTVRLDFYMMGANVPQFKEASIPELTDRFSIVNQQNSMSYSNVFFDRRKSQVHLWEYDENGDKVHRTEPAPLYFYVASRNGDFKTIDGRKAKKVECSTSGEFREKIGDAKSMGLETFESDVSIEDGFTHE